ncbi:MAG: hypothetical protein FWE08_06485 [Oscillospiraceae bacterium]|nr:hypothetical protein [Oscillospiraceae bacterium]
MKKPGRWLVSVLIAIVIAVWAAMESLQPSAFVEFFRTISLAEVLALLVFVLVFRLSLALIFFGIKAAKAAGEVASSVTNAANAVSELDFLNELERQQNSAPAPPPAERSVTCAGCGATVVVRGGQAGECEYCRRSV